MAGGFWRGHAAQSRIFEKNLERYIGGILGTGKFAPGVTLENILGGLVGAQMPQFEDIMGKYMGQAAGLGQAVPGQGLSGKATEGMMQTGADWMTANVLGPALQVYTTPWQGIFGSAGQIPADYMGAQQMKRYERMAPLQSALSLGGTLGGAYLGGPAMSGGGGGGGGCCFILTEANDGVLDDIARKFRDEYGTPKQKSGYRRLANWLVPKMKESKAIKNLVKFFMVKPMIQAGKFLYGKNHWGYIFAPIAMSWLTLFQILGAKKNYDFVYSASA